MKIKKSVPRGRLTLTKVVLGNLPTFYFSLFIAPAGILKALEKIRRRFLWGGSEDSRKINWVSWGKVTAPKENGGLGLGSLKALNLSLIMKWWWRLRVENTCLWSKVIEGIHNLKNKPRDYMSKQSITGVWKNITQARGELMKVGINIEDVILKEVGTGEKTMFWHDRWTGNMTLKASFPEMYKLERHKHCMVNERILPGGLVWNWKASITSPEQIREADLLLNRVSNIQLGTRNDK